MVLEMKPQCFNELDRVRKTVAKINPVIASEKAGFHSRIFKILGYSIRKVVCLSKGFMDPPS